MGILHKDLQERNKVYDALIEHFKNKIITENKNTITTEWLIDTYDNEVKKADRGDVYLFEKLLACGFGGLSMGLITGGVWLDEPALYACALVSSGISVYNYIKYKRLKSARGLGTRMFYAEVLQNILEENNGIAMGNSEKKYIYLTFDEGYEAGYTEKILEVLKQNQVPATFFITAHYVNTQEDLVRQMINEGHIVGNHTPKFLMSGIEKI